MHLPNISWGMCQSRMQVQAKCGTSEHSWWGIYNDAVQGTEVQQILDQAIFARQMGRYVQRMRSVHLELDFLC
jgi:hypothetical protein